MAKKSDTVKRAKPPRRVLKRTRAAVPPAVRPEPNNARQEDAMAEAVVANDRFNRATSVIKKYDFYAGGWGLLPLPIVDVVALFAVQRKLVRKLAAIYEVPFSEERAKAVIAPLLGSIIPTGLAWGSFGSLVKSLPLVGPLLGALTMPLLGGAATHALGRTFVQHFESGGVLLDFDPVRAREHFHHHFQESVAARKAGSPA
jgi:uncharacterized protein (DUF697 family)